MEYRDIVIFGCKDSKELYRRVSSVNNNINVIDAGDKTYVYGDMSQEDYDIVIHICHEYGDIE